MALFSFRTSKTKRKRKITITKRIKSKIESKIRSARRVDRDSRIFSCSISRYPVPILAPGW